jgi:hypothetical protein
VPPSSESRRRVTGRPGAPRSDGPVGVEEAGAGAGHTGGRRVSPPPESRRGSPTGEGAPRSDGPSVSRRLGRGPGRTAPTRVGPAGPEEPGLMGSRHFHGEFDPPVNTGLRAGELATGSARYPATHDSRRGGLPVGFTWNTPVGYQTPAYMPEDQPLLRTLSRSVLPPGPYDGEKRGGNRHRPRTVKEVAASDHGSASVDLDGFGLGSSEGGLGQACR